jgi:hypothetical protein
MAVSLLSMSAVSPKAPTVGGRDQFIFNPWHYLPILERKPSALRHGAPFQEWNLPAPIQAIRDRLPFINHLNLPL